jgi:nicotinamide riboside transporter PnuC
MAKTVAKLLGLVLLLVGILGFTHLLDSLGAHLSPVHNCIHIVSGILAVYFGFAGSLSGAKSFCTIFGLIYLLLGIVGLALGDLHIGPLLLGKVDHGIHLILGAIFLAGGLFTKS